jgi:hypothetical protein
LADHDGGYEVTIPVQVDALGRCCGKVVIANDALMLDLKVAVNSLIEGLFESLAKVGTQ